MLGSSPRPLGGRIKKSMKQSPGREVVHSWGDSSWLYNHRNPAKRVEVSKVPHRLASLSLEGFLCSPSGGSGVSCFLQFRWSSAAAAAEAAARRSPRSPGSGRQRQRTPKWPHAPSATSRGAILVEVPTGLAGSGRRGRLWKRLELSTEGPEACEPWRLAAHLTPERCPKPQGSCARPVFASK